jgi:hypothetical protein
MQASRQSVGIGMEIPKNAGGEDETEDEIRMLQMISFAFAQGRLRMAPQKDEQPS